LPTDEVDEYLELRIAYVEAGERELKFTAHGKRYEKIVGNLKRHEFKGSKVQRFKR